MTTATQSKAVTTPVSRNMQPTRISRALRPLREILEELSKSKTLTKSAHDQVESCVKGLTTYVVYQEDKEKSGEEMFPEAIRRSAEEASDLHKMLVSMSKTKGLEKFTELIQPSNEIVHRLKQLATRLEKRDPKPAVSSVAASRPVEPKEAKASPPIQVRSVNGGIQMGNLIIQDRALALELIQLHLA